MGVLKPRDGWKLEKDVDLPTCRELSELTTKLTPEEVPTLELKWVSDY